MLRYQTNEMTRERDQKQEERRALMNLVEYARNCAEDIEDRTASLHLEAALCALKGDLH